MSWLLLLLAGCPDPAPSPSPITPPTRPVPTIDASVPDADAQPPPLRARLSGSYDVTYRVTLVYGPDADSLAYLRERETDATWIATDAGGVLIAAPVGFDDSHALASYLTSTELASTPFILDASGVFLAPDSDCAGPHWLQADETNGQTFDDDGDNIADRFEGAFIGDVLWLTDGHSVEVLGEIEGARDTRPPSIALEPDLPTIELGGRIAIASSELLTGPPYATLDGARLLLEPADPASTKAYYATARLHFDAELYVRAIDVAGNPAELTFHTPPQPEPFDGIREGMNGVLEGDVRVDGTELAFGAGEGRVTLRIPTAGHTQLRIDFDRDVFYVHAIGDIGAASNARPFATIFDVSEQDEVVIVAGRRAVQNCEGALYRVPEEQRSGRLVAITVD